jgi:hypothetical protein
VPNRPKTHKVDLPRSSAGKGKKRLYNSAKWRRIRKIVLARDVVCQICFERPAVHCDHIGNDTSTSLDALQGLCRQCHGRKTREDMQHLQPEPDSKPARQFPEDYVFV